METLSLHKRTGKFRRLPLAVCLSMAAVIFAACGSEEPAATADAPETSADVGSRAGQMAPDFDLTTVEGEQVSLSSLQGQPTVLYFFATW